MQPLEIFISASDLAQNDCSNTVWRWGNSSGQNKVFDQTIFMFMFYIKASYKYVNSECVPGHLHFKTKQIRVSLDRVYVMKNVCK